MADVFRTLQQQLDRYSIGFPETESGIELDILKHLFSEEDAALAVQMSPALETPEKVAARVGRPVDDVGRHLDDMAERGLLFRLRKGGVDRYGASPFVHGIFEYQVRDLDRELAQMVWRYFDEAFHETFSLSGQYFLRTVPIQESIETEQRVAPYDDAVAMLRERDQIVVIDCICRKRSGLVEEGCGKPLEACFMFGSMGQFYLDRGIGRVVDVDEAVAILDRCQEAGLVTQPATAQNPAGMCNCCGDCCPQLAALNKHPRPAEVVFSNYIAALDQDICNGCETCVDRCQVGAMTMTGDDRASLDLARCIGCGLCVTTCETGALSLHRKPEDQLRVPPADSREQMMTLAMKRRVF
jgi:ferredoxin